MSIGTAIKARCINAMCAVIEGFIGTSEHKLMLQYGWGSKVRKRNGQKTWAKNLVGFFWPEGLRDFFEMRCRVVLLRTLIYDAGRDFRALGRCRWIIGHKIKVCNPIRWELNKAIERLGNRRLSAIELRAWRNPLLGSDLALPLYLSIRKHF